ncbi:MAG: HAMP domain-containing sensor histidine kinase, partial [Terracoccus sp.]
MGGVDHLYRPLDGIRSVKAKLALLVGTSIVAAAVVVQIGAAASVPVWLTVPVTVSAALGVTQWLARGLTSPLREMTDAASRMATGDYSRRVTATSADEVGLLAAAFNTMAADLADADRQRRQLVATVSHELRTPLAAQQALLENLVDGVVRPDDAVLRAALAQAERLGSLVGDLLDLSRLDGGQIRLDLAPVSVLGLVERGVAEAALGSRAITHDVAVSPPDLRVVADAARLAQVLANLLENAARHCPPGSTVHVTATGEGPDRWSLEVTDDGPGIPQRHAERIFRRFGSGDDAGGGTGIGLAIASWVCELHGGSISAEPPAPGQSGARLRAVLPRHPNPAVNAPTHQHTLESPVPVTPVTPTSLTSLTSLTSPPAQPVAPPRPFLDAVFGDLWPEAGLAPKTGLVMTCLGVGLLAAVILPGRDVGLALFAVLIGGGAVVLRSSVRSRSLWTGVSAVLCVALASLVVFRAAQW